MKNRSTHKSKLLSHFPFQMTLNYANSPSCFKMTKLLKNNDNTLIPEKKTHQRRQKFAALLLNLDLCDPSISKQAHNSDDDDESDYNSLCRNCSTASEASYNNSGFYSNMMAAAAAHDRNNDNTSPYYMSPLNQASSPYMKSPWSTKKYTNINGRYSYPTNARLIGSLVREEGHIYALATCGDLLYTGSESKNIRVWKNLQDFSGFKSNSGLVKAIVVYEDKVFTGHQDGKIRVWKFKGISKNKPYQRVGSLPTPKDYFKSSINPKSYVEVRRNRSVPWIRHVDTISCMAVDADSGLLYSGSWDKTLKVWRLSDFKCIESINAHNDAVNSVVVGFDGLIFTGSADGSVRTWRRELVGNNTKHVLVNVLLEQENAVTSLAVNVEAEMLYAGSSDGLVNFWEREKQFISYGGVLRGHKLAVLCVAAVGRVVFSGSADKSICVWKREEGGIHTFMCVLTGHTGPVKCLTVKPERHGSNNEEDEELSNHDREGNQRWIVYSGSLDNSVHVWSVTENVSDHECKEV